ncbi:hypothetical protein HPO96_16760 [Kribbella sandramycini]|uniref:Putative membrane protein n=1 Tax=Kribbella sandramycini TaxID=60450 RepID=A0A7Y4P1A8_9ACTN|nr:hypothetical protein [Kribbella sandramycini]MBB6565636.1 putative membrane protein [Kribbella sandramycini]NOL41899.1 hypothetical protein [Kribbella sandramycini]
MSEMERRDRRVQRIVAVTYLGFPVLLLGIVAWVGLNGPTAAWAGAVVPLGMLAAGVVLRGRHRFHPRWWAAIGGLFGGLAGLIGSLYPLVIGVWWPAILALPFLILGLLAGLLLARRANHTLLVPYSEELADSAYELVFRLRGAPAGLVLLGADSVTIQGHPMPRTPDQSRTYPLSALTGTFEVDLSGAERLKFPIALTVVGTAGPALILQAAGEDWVLPTNEAPILLQLLDRRRTR